MMVWVFQPSHDATGPARSDSRGDLCAGADQEADPVSVSNHDGLRASALCPPSLVPYGADRLEWSRARGQRRLGSRRAAQQADPASWAPNLSAITLLSRGVAHVIDQAWPGPVLLDRHGQAGELAEPLVPGVVGVPACQVSQDAAGLDEPGVAAMADGQVA